MSEAAIEGLKLFNVTGGYKGWVEINSGWSPFGGAAAFDQMTMPVKEIA